MIVLGSTFVYPLLLDWYGTHSDHILLWFRSTANFWGDNFNSHRTICKTWRSFFIKSSSTFFYIRINDSSPIAGISYVRVSKNTNFCAQKLIEYFVFSYCWRLTVLLEISNWTELNWAAHSQIYIKIQQFRRVIVFFRGFETLTI